MIQRCPNCGQWCETGKDGILDRAVGGWADTVVNDGKTGKSLAGDVGEFFGSTFGFYRGILKGTAEAVFGDKYNFVCPKCGQEWSTNDESDDETEEYEEEMRLRNLTSPDTAIQKCHNGEVRQYINELRSVLADTDHQGIQAMAYDALAYCSHEAMHDDVKALEYINNSLSIVPDDSNSRAMRGVINCSSNVSVAPYDCLKDLAYVWAEDGEHPFYASSFIEEQISLALQHYSDKFLAIPYQRRKFLMIVDDLSSLPKGSLERSINILTNDYIPAGIQFLSGVHQLNELYVCHPYNQTYYIPYNNYQVELLKDEVRELQIFFSNLGAKSISIIDTSSDESAKANKHDMSGSVSGKYKGVGGSVSGEMNSDHQLSEWLRRELNIGTTFEQGERVTVGSKGWAGTKEWQDFAKMRMNKQESLRFVLSTSQSRIINESEAKQLSADFAAIVCSGSVAGKQSSSKSLRTQQEHSWTLQVEFYPLSSYNKKEDAPTALPVASEKKGLNKVYLAFICVIILLLGLIAWLIGK